MWFETGKNVYKRMKRLLLLVLALTAFSLQLFAVKAYPYPVTVTQPDGTTLTIRIYGDENRSWKTTLQGRPVYQGPDGFWRETDSLPPQRTFSKQLRPEGGSLSLFVATKSPVHVRTLVIPVQFKDRKFTVPSPRSAIYNLFNQQFYAEGGATGSVLDWFRDNLGDYGNFSFEVCDVVTLPNASAWYGANADGMTDKNLPQMVVHACAAADAAGVDFTRYDFDGDGVVDNVFLFFAGHNEAEGGGDDCIWPQSWNVSDQGLVLDGMKISNFSTYSEYAGPSGYRFAGIGTICHEYCHFLGLQDLYDVNGDKEGETPGLYGTLSIMDQGNYNNEGRTPPYLTVFERQMVSLVKENQVRAGQELLVGPVQESTSAWVILTGNPGEAFWLEYRDGTKWDFYAGGAGLVVYHIDKSNAMAGSMSAKMRWTAGAVNGCAAHPCATFVSSRGEDPADVTDAFFPGPRNVRTIHSASTFPLRRWDGRGIGYGLEGIVREADGVRCRVVVDESWDLPVMTAWSIVPEQTSALLEWQVDKTSNGQWNLRWGIRNGIESETIVLGDKTRYSFENLIPGEWYYCELFYTHWAVTGKVYRMEFQALDRLSDYPLIGGFDRTWHVGDTFRLFLLNLTDPDATVNWSIDGASCTSQTYVFKHAGSYKISATIRFQDGSRETLTKIMEVKDGS